MVPFNPGVADACAVGVGAACGALSRHCIGKAAAERIAADPKRLSHLTSWHTAVINISGSFLLGGLAGIPSSAELVQARAKATATAVPRLPTALPATLTDARVKLMLGVGFCGSFTTFSTYSVDVINMIGKGEIGKAVSYGIANNAGGFLAAAAGVVLMRKLFGLKV